MRSHDNITPPHFWLKFFRWFCRAEYAEDIEGDLVERFYARVEKIGTSKAKKRFRTDVLKLFRPSMIKKLEGNQKLNYYGMFKHNFIINLRNFKRHKSSFLINLAGLTSGLTCVLLIYLWVMDEVSMDKFHENKDNLYRIQSNHSTPNGIMTWRGVPGLLYEEILANVPEISAAAVYTDVHEYTISWNEKPLKANLRFASPDYFDVFSYPTSKGNPDNTLKDESNILVSEAFAQKLFGKSDPIGQVISFSFWENKQDFIVSGVLEDIPSTSSEQFEAIFPWNYYHDKLIDYKQWGNYYGRIAIVLKDNANPKDSGDKINKIFKANTNEDRVDLFLTPFTDNYLYGTFENGKPIGGRIEYVRLFSVIALFILLIACINFINLSTAQAGQRMKEIGIKKSMGATKGSLMLQFFMESVMLSIISLLLAYGLVSLALPQFNNITQKSLSLSFDWSLFQSSLSLILIIGVIAGAYPALYLSGLKTLEVLKGKLTGKSGRTYGRKALVVIQFCLSTIMVVSVFVVFKQMEFIQKENLGYDRDNLVYFEREGELLKDSNSFLAELKKIPGVIEADVSGFMVGGMNNTRGISWEGQTEEQQVSFWEFKSGYSTIDLLGVEIIEGTGFSPELTSSERGILFNEKAIQAMGIEDPIGKTVQHYIGERKIIGIVKDFNIGSMHTPIEPAAFLYEPNSAHFIMAKIQAGTEINTIQQIENTYKSFNPNYPFELKFVDQDYQALYASEMRIKAFSKYFAALAILISCLGLFGLTSFTTQRRIKEIGIRKVLGSSTQNIVLLLTRQFSVVVLIAIVIGLPIAYWLANSWLNDFAYKINLSWWFFVGSGLMAFVVAWLTIVLQTFNTAKLNPAKSLRSE